MARVPNLHPRQETAFKLLCTVVLWVTAGIITLLCALAIGIAAVIFAVTLGPFYFIGGVAEWIRNRKARNEA